MEKQNKFMPAESNYIEPIWTEKRSVKNWKQQAKHAEAQYEAVEKLVDIGESGGWNIHSSNSGRVCLTSASWTWNKINDLYEEYS